MYLVGECEGVKDERDDCHINITEWTGKNVVDAGQTTVARRICTRNEAESSTVANCIIKPDKMFVLSG